MKKLVLFVLVCAATQVALAQKKYYTKAATVSFVNQKDVTATNKAGAVVIDSKTGGVTVSVLIKSFTFTQALMQTHFNDNYMESTKYPKSEFKGTINNNTDIKYTTNGTYSAKVTGKLTMHGVTNDVSTTATITVASGKVSAKGSFTVTLSDYSVKSDRISKTATVSFDTGSLSEK